MGTFTRGEIVEAVEPIRIASGYIIETGARGKVIGSSPDDSVVSVQFDDYIGAVSVLWSVIAPSAPAPTVAEGDSGYTELIDELNGRIKGLERRVEAAENLLRKIEMNSPQSEPKDRLAPQTLPQAWSHWVSGEYIRAYFSKLPTGGGE